MCTTRECMVHCCQGIVCTYMLHVRMYVHTLVYVCTVCTYGSTVANSLLCVRACSCECVCVLLLVLLGTHSLLFPVSAPLLLHMVLVGLAVQYEGSSRPSDGMSSTTAVCPFGTADVRCATRLGLARTRACRFDCTS